MSELEKLEADFNKKKKELQNRCKHTKSALKKLELLDEGSD